MAATGFEIIEDGPWPNGIWDVESQQTAPSGFAYGIQDMFIADDGNLVGRGGATYAATTALGSTGLRFVVAAQLPVGQRVLFGNTANVAALNSSTLPAAQTTLGASFTLARTKPVRASVVHGLMTVDGDGTNAAFQWGGSLKPNYTTGTVATTAGSATVTGVGTTWSTNVDKGMIFTIGGGTHFLVHSIDSNTQITLASPFDATHAAGTGYLLETIRALNTDAFVAAAANRLFSVRFDRTNRVYFTAPNAPTGVPGTNDYIEFGTQVLGMAPLRDTLMVFTARGVYQVSGIALNLTDASGNPQWRVDLVNSEMVLWGRSGLASWGGALIAPCLDGVYLIDGVSSPVRMSQQISSLYSDYAGAASTWSAGGGAVFKGHYFLPVLSSGAASTVLVCRLESAQGGKPFAWVTCEGNQISQYASSGGDPQKLFAASPTSSAAASKLQEASSYFAPTSAVTADAAGTGPDPQLTTRVIEGPNRVSNYLAKTRVQYFMSGGSGSIAMSYRDDDGALVAASGTAASGGTEFVANEYAWRIGERVRSLQSRFAAAASNKVTLNRVRYFVRLAGRR